MTIDARMMPMAVGVAIVFLVVWIATAVIRLYNRLIADRNACDNAFSTIDVQLKQRCDLVPRVVAAVTGYMQHERGVLEELTALRSRAVTTGLDAASRMTLDAQMAGLLGQVFVRAEAYPQLKAADSVLLLQRTLNEVEAQIAAARRTYNAAVTEYNIALESFPANVVAPALGFARRPLFEAAASERLAVDVRV